MTVYLANPPSAGLKEELGFYEEARGANTWQVVPTGEGVFDGVEFVDEIRCVHPGQAYVDLKDQFERVAEAQAESAPALKAEATARSVVRNWATVPDAARYELMTWRAIGAGWQPIGGDNLAGTTRYDAIRAGDTKGGLNEWPHLEQQVSAPISEPLTAAAGNTLEKTYAEERAALDLLYETTDGAN